MVRGRPVNPSYRYSAAAAQLGVVADAQVLFAPEVFGEAHHSACSAVVQLEPVVYGDVNFLAFSSTVFELDVHSVAVRGLPAQAGVAIEPVVSAVAKYVYLANGDASIQPSVSGFAYRPAVLVNAAAQVMPTADGYAIRGTTGRAAAVVVPQVLTTTFRVFYCSTDATVQPNVAALAEFTPLFDGARGSSNFHVTPLIAGAANV